MKGKRTSEPPVDRRQRRPNPRAVNAATRRRGQNASVEIVLTQADVDNAWLCQRYQLTQQQFTRWQSVVGAALERLDRSRCLGELDESFWTALRDALSESGATEREIDLVAACAVRVVVSMIVKQTLAAVEADPELLDVPREELLESISEELAGTAGEALLESIALYLARTDMTIRFAPDASVRRVEFPERWVQ
jgi:hypothetical protein